MGHFVPYCLWWRLIALGQLQVAYNQAMASCSWEQAWACFNAMRRAGVQPNTRSYNAVRPPVLISSRADPG